MKYKQFDPNYEGTVIISIMLIWFIGLYIGSFYYTPSICEYEPVQYIERRWGWDRRTSETDNIPNDHIIYTKSELVCK